MPSPSPPLSTLNTAGSSISRKVILHSAKADQPHLSRYCAVASLFLITQPCSEVCMPSLTLALSMEQPVLRPIFKGASWKCVKETSPHFCRQGTEVPREVPTEHCYWPGTQACSVCSELRKRRYKPALSVSVRLSPKYIQKDWEHMVLGIVVTPCDNFMVSCLATESSHLKDSSLILW